MKLQNLIHIVIGIVCVGLLANAEAVNPPPDGGYPGHNTAEGQNALLILTTGVFNTANGWLSLRAVTTGSFNTGVGAGTLALNTADENTATGAGALLSNTTGFENMANGAFALFSNTAGYDNTANGAFALFSNTEGVANTATGDGALYNNTSGAANTATGNGALLINTIGFENTATGEAALYNNTTGFDNTATGEGALFNNTTGENNIAIGSSAGINVTTGGNNICIGNEGEGSDSGVIRIGNSSQSQIFIPAINQTGFSGNAVVIDPTNGRLGTMPSSRRFKQNIKPMDKSSEAILELTPVTFCYKKDIDPQGIQQFGLLAEDVEKVNSKLVVRDKEGKAHSIRYEAVNAMLLNEFLKEHRTVQKLKSNAAKQEATMARQQEQIEALAAGLQKVNAQLEAGKPAPQVVHNP